MTLINETHVESIIATCRENAAAIAESLNQCFDRQYEIRLGQSQIWSEEAADGLNGPGLSVILRCGTQALVCLIPADLPLPDWYTAPGDSENARLQTLSLEWSMNMLPPDLEAEEFVTIDCENLHQHVADSEPAEWAGVLELHVYDATDGDAAPDESKDDAAAAESTEEGDNETAEKAAETPIARLYLITAVEKPLLPEPATESEPAVSAAPSAPTTRQPSAAASLSASNSPIDRQMHKLPVTVSVRLAEKKIELGQLASITPGGLVTFNKSCESLLDLYVNNHLYGRGEAIKIGEKFGLKVTHVGVKPQQRKRVL